MGLAGQGLKTIIVVISGKRNLTTYPHIIRYLGGGRVVCVECEKASVITAGFDKAPVEQDITQIR